MGAGCKQYDFRAIEPFWQKRWLKEGTFCAEPEQKTTKKKYYVLDMFPYPSSMGLHIGHPEGYTASDVLARYYWAKGYNVLHPMGWDAFGLPAEQHAIATGRHPSINTQQNINRFREQIQSLGFAIDWEREVDTTDPNYYRWTQWIFLQLFKHGLAYVDEKPVWWCPGLKSVLANEEVINGRSERGNFPVERRNLRQWVLRITCYADKLLDGLEGIDWPESTKRQQIAWIGRSEGTEIRFPIEHTNDVICVYTTRPDTLFGVSFVAIAPEHPLVGKVITEDHREAVGRYIEEAKHKSDLERTGLAKEKTGVFTGSYVLHPLTGEQIPIWVADYVLPSYGTGAVMAVPAHDERDFEFAKKYQLPIRAVIKPSVSVEKIPDSLGQNEQEVSLYGGAGILVNSGAFNGITTEEAKKKITEALQKKGAGQPAIKYKLRDWLFSRQRYWGEPIPILWIEKTAYDQAIKEGKAYFEKLVPEEAVSYRKGGIEYCAIPLKEEDLPLQLPEVESYLPSDDGESPLARATDWLHVYINLETGELAKDSKPGFVLATRETNTMPQWAGSCWYYLRYMSPHESNALVNSEAEAYWQHPDFYIGGAEHAVLHLLYARFWHLFLYDIGVLKAAKEPFQRLFHQGIILGNDGTKMSKSRGNVVNPDDVVQAYGADSLRLYEMFLGPLNAMKPWNTKGIEGVYRFLKKVWVLYLDSEGEVKPFAKAVSSEIETAFNETVQKVTSDIEQLQFNTAISQMMIFVNTVGREPLTQKIAKEFLQLLAPFAPHIAEELWERIGENFSIAHEPWPKMSDVKIQKEQKIVVQINGKVRGELTISVEASEQEVIEKTMQLEKVQTCIVGKEIVKQIYIPGKILSIVVR